MLNVHLLPWWNICFHNSQICPCRNLKLQFLLIWCKYWRLLVGLHNVTSSDFFLLCVCVWQCLDKQNKLKTNSVAKAGLELVIFLPWALKCWNSRHRISVSTCFFFLPSLLKRFYVNNTFWSCFSTPIPPSVRMVSFAHVTLFWNLNILFAVSWNTKCFNEVTHKRWAEL